MPRDCPGNFASYSIKAFDFIFLNREKVFMASLPSFIILDRLLEDWLLEDIGIVCSSYNKS